MILGQAYDDQGKDGQDNQAAWERLPPVYQYFFTTQQKSIDERVRRAVFEKFGQAGLDDLRKVSGWRSHVVNKRVGGVADSAHLIAAAVDYAKFGIFRSQPIPVPSCLVCISSRGWHVMPVSMVK